MESDNEAGAGPLVVLDGVDGAPLADQQLQQIIDEALDLSDGNDALAAVVDSTDPHLGPTRSSLLAPIRVWPGMRVLELGCGAGALTRGLADLGAHVTAVEPSLAMARLAASRNRDRPEVSVVAAAVGTWAGRLGGDERPYDLAVVAPVGSGILAGTAAMRPDDLLPIAAAALQPEGVLVLAVDNPLGIAALSGARMTVPPPIAPDGFPVRAARSPWAMTSVRVSELLASVGCTEQTLFAVFPDLVAPQTMLTGRLLDSAEGRRLAAAFQRDLARLPDRTGLRTDSRWLADTAMSSGLGLAFASSLLGVASRSRSGLGSMVRPGHLFALPSPVKGARWRRTRVLLGGPGSWELGPLDSGRSTEVVDGPLRMREFPGPVVIGRNAEDVLVDRLLAEGLDGPGSSAILAGWWTAASDIVREPQDGGWQFDVGPRNFIIDDDGAWHFIDRELTVLERPADGIHAWRAMAFLLADRIIPAGIPPGLPAALTVRQVVTMLLDRIGVPDGEDGMERWIAFESDIQHRIRPRIESQRHEAEALRDICGWRLDRVVAHGSVDVLRPLAARAVELEGRLAVVSAALAAADTRATQAESAAAAAEIRAETATTRYWETQRLHGEAEARARVAEDQLLRLADEGRTSVSPRRLVDRIGPPMLVAAQRTQGVIGRVRARRLPAADFDADWYRARYPDVARSGMDPWHHWRHHGIDERRAPGPWFDTAWYLATYPDVAAAGIDPLTHYRRFGRAEGRDPYRPVVEGDPPPPDIVDASTGPRLLAVYDVDLPQAIDPPIPRYPGHQPPIRPFQLPVDGADSSAIALQGRRARAFGFDGFCFRSTWREHGAAAVLSWLARPDADVGPFAIRWVDAGADQDRDRSLAVLRALAGRRSLRMGGHPVLILDGQVGSVASLARSMRQMAREQGLPVPRILGIRSSTVDPGPAREVDGWVRDQPDRPLLERLDRQVLTPDDDVLVVDHSAAWPVLAFPPHGTADVPVVLAGWDETGVPGAARPTVIDLVTADGYGRWLASEIARSSSGGHDGIVLVDGWNRWTVGASVVRDPGQGPDLLAVTRSVRERTPPGPVTP